MRKHTKHFDFEDRVLMELQFIAGAFGIIHSLDPERIIASELEQFGDGMAWFTEFLYNDLAEYFYPKDGG